jgi:hypothetical protein
MAQKNNSRLVGKPDIKNDMSGLQRLPGTEIFEGFPTAECNRTGKTHDGAPKRHYNATEWCGIALSEG